MVSTSNRQQNMNLRHPPHPPPLNQTPPNQTYNPLPSKPNLRQPPPPCNQTCINPNQAYDNPFPLNPPPPPS